MKPPFAAAPVAVALSLVVLSGALPFPCQFLALPLNIYVMKKVVVWSVAREMAWNRARREAEGPLSVETMFVGALAERKAWLEP